MKTLLPLVALLLLTTTGCATLLKSKTEPVTFQSSPAEAEVWLDGGYRGTTPLVLELQARKAPTVVFKKDGYKDQSLPLTTSVGVGWVVADVAAGGFAPLAVDAVTGNWYQFDSRLVNATLTPLLKPAPPAVEESESPEEAPVATRAPAAPKAPKQARRAPAARARTASAAVE
jgi:hypothetical protein